jgi:L-threonylcarbamoyladenylate synthase
VGPVRLRLGELPEDEIARRAADVLRRGGIALLPAEGVYGFHAFPHSASAMKRIFALKQRTSRAGFIGLIARPEHAGRWAIVDDVARELAGTHWPGSLTLVLEAGPSTPEVLRSSDGTVALRCPGSSFLRSVITAIGGVDEPGSAPLLSTSANRSGSPPATKVADAPMDVAELVVDGGVLSGTPSTVARVSNGVVSILRPGAVKLGGRM